MKRVRRDPLFEWLDPVGRMLDWPEFFCLMESARSMAAEQLRVEELVSDRTLTVRNVRVPIDRGKAAPTKVHVRKR